MVKGYPEGSSAKLKTIQFIVKGHSAGSSIKLKEVQLS